MCAKWSAKKVHIPLGVHPVQSTTVFLHCAVACNLHWMHLQVFTFGAQLTSRFLHWGKASNAQISRCGLQSSLTGTLADKVCTHQCSIFQKLKQQKCNGFVLRSRFETGFHYSLDLQILPAGSSSTCSGGVHGCHNILHQFYFLRLKVSSHFNFNSPSHDSLPYEESSNSNVNQLTEFHMDSRSTHTMKRLQRTQSLDVNSHILDDDEYIQRWANFKSRQERLGTHCYPCGDRAPLTHTLDHAHHTPRARARPSSVTSYTTSYKRRGWHAHVLFGLEERERENDCERESVCVCVCVCERERER